MHSVSTLTTLPFSASSLTDTSSGESQVIAAGVDRLSLVGDKTPQDVDDIDSLSKAFPIPPRRTKKLSKNRSNSCSTIFEGESLSPNMAERGVQPQVYKRPICEQRSNPELSLRSRPPRPPPPARPLPPRTFTEMDKTHLAGKSRSKQSMGQLPVVIDTRGRRRHSHTPQPKRPPLPYETFVRQTDRHGSCGGSGNPDVETDAQNEEQPDSPDGILSPADYEVVVPVGARLRNVSASTRYNIPTGKLQPRPAGGNKVTDSSKLKAEENIYSTIDDKGTKSPVSFSNDRNEVFRESDSLVKALAKCETAPSSKPRVSPAECVKQESKNETGYYQLQ